jgi:hypothetical protein
MPVSELITYFCLVLILASVFIACVAVLRRRWIGLGLGLLAISGAFLSIFLSFGIAVAFEDPGGPFQLDSFRLNGVGLVGLTFFYLGARFGLRHKRPRPKTNASSQ